MYVDISICICTCKCMNIYIYMRYVYVDSEYVFTCIYACSRCLLTVSPDDVVRYVPCVDEARRTQVQADHLVLDGWC